MNDQLREDLEAARALIDTPEKWIKGVLSNAYDQKHGQSARYCAFGACHQAITGQWQWPTSHKGVTDEEFKREKAAKMALQAALPEDFQEEGFLSEIHVPSVPGFNNASDTTHEDMMALYDRAIKQAIEN
jgi:hypothetical protein